MRAAAAVSAFLVIASSASALDVAINDPIASSVWDSGKDARVSWVVLETGSMPERVGVALMKGNNNYDDATLVAQLGEANTRDAAIAVKAPANMPTGDDWFIRIGAPGSYKYSAAFTLKGNGTELPKPDPKAGQIKDLPRSGAPVSAHFSPLALMVAVSAAVACSVV